MVRDAGQARQELRIRECSEFLPARDAPAFRQDGTYLVVGALGKAGETVCRELGRRYRAKLIILSRRPPERAREILRRIEAAGASVEYHSVDVADIAALKNEIDVIRTNGTVINGTIHIAIEVVDGRIITKDSSEFTATIGPTVSGTMNLDEVLAGAELDFFMVFSSVTSFGLKGASDYAYSTAFQNAMIRDRNRLVEKGARKGRGIAICWGQWQIDGASREGVMSDHVPKLKEVGMDVIDPTSAFRVMELALKDPREVSAYIAVSDKAKVLRMLGIESTPAVDPHALPEKAVRPFDDVERANSVIRLPETSKPPAPRIKTKRVELPHKPLATPLQRAAPTPVTASERVLINMEKVLGVKRESIDPDRCFQDYGLDSLTAVQLTTALEKEFGRYVPPSWLTEYSNISALSQKIAATT